MNQENKSVDELANEYANQKNIDRWHSDAEYSRKWPEDDFKAGFLAASSKGKEEDWGNGWDAAITFANNLCVKISDDYNSADMVIQDDTATYCAQQIIKAHGDRSYKPEDIFAAPQPKDTSGMQDENIRDLKRWISGWAGEDAYRLLKYISQYYSLTKISHHGK